MNRRRTVVATLALAFLAVCIVALRYAAARPWYESIDAGAQVSRESAPEIDSVLDGVDDLEEDLDFADQEFEEPLSREIAYEILLKTEEFAGAAVGFGGECSNQVLAFRRVLREPDAARAYGDLLRRGRVAGQLYALCGLYLTDREAFRSAVPRYTRDAAEIDTLQGCMGMERPVSQVLRGIVSGKWPRVFRGRE